MSVYLNFPVHNRPFILPFFPPFLLFPFLHRSFLLRGISIALEPPSFPSHFLVSLSCFFLCFRSLMVDYSVVKSNCPLVSFFFARLRSLLNVVGRRRPKVGLFVGRNCPFRFALCFLFLLVHHSVGLLKHWLCLERVRLGPVNLK